MTLRISNTKHKQHSALILCIKCHCAECHLLFIVFLNDVMLCVIMLNVLMPSVILLSVVVPRIFVRSLLEMFVNT